MANIKMTDANKVAKLTQIQNNIGTARTDEFYFESPDIVADDVHSIAFKKDFVITITIVNERISKMVFANALT